MSAIEISTDDFQQNFPHQGFKVKHRLCTEPLLDLGELAKLSERLPQSSIEHNAADLAVNQQPAAVERSQYTARDAIEQLDTANTWVVLKNVETDDAYRALLHNTLEPVIQQASNTLSGIKEYEAFIFVSSPNSVTPFHIDPEHNFLLQVRGEKTVYQWDKHDTSTLDPATVETAVYTDAHRNLEYRDEFTSRQKAFHLTPGEGLYFPVRAPHWVKNGPQPSVSFSITFRSSQSEREFRLYRRNGKLRSLGRQTLPVHQYPLLDLLRDTALRAANKFSSRR